MKLNKKRLLGLALGLVLVLLVIGYFSSNSVDYDETEVYNEINFIKKAAMTSSHLNEKTEAIVNIYDNYKTYMIHKTYIIYTMIMNVGVEKPLKKL